MSSSDYLVGAQVVVTATFSSPLGPIDPTDARVDVLNPSGITTTYSYSMAQVTKVSTGVYSYTIDTTGKTGRWNYRWWSPPPIGAAGSGGFVVDPFPND
jgi:hypothetical protein